MYIDYDTRNQPVMFDKLQPGDCFMVYTIEELDKPVLYMKTTAVDDIAQYNAVRLDDGTLYNVKKDDLIVPARIKLVFE